MKGVNRPISKRPPMLGRIFGTSEEARRMVRDAKAEYLKNEKVRQAQAQMDLQKIVEKSSGQKDGVRIES